MTHDLSDKHVAFLVADKGTEHIELVEPVRGVLEAGGETTLVSMRAGKISTNNHDLEPGSEMDADVAFADANANDYDAVVVPGGTVGADRLRNHPEAVNFVKAFLEKGKPVAAICHGPWVLVEPGIVDGRRLTSYPSLATDIRNAGGNWVDEEVVVDNGLVTSRKPADLPAFVNKLLEEVGEGAHAGQRA